MLRPPARRWTRAQVADRIADAPGLEHGWIEGAELDALCEAYTAITGDPVRTGRKKQLVAAVSRVHGADTLAYIEEVFRATGTATNLLGLLRTVDPRPKPVPVHPHPGGTTRGGDLPATSPVTSAAARVDPASWDGCRCLLDRLGQDLIYCADHRPAFGSVGSARHDRRPSNPLAARFFTDVDSCGTPGPGAT